MYVSQVHTLSFACSSGLLCLGPLSFVPSVSQGHSKYHMVKVRDGEMANWQLLPSTHCLAIRNKMPAGLKTVLGHEAGLPSGTVSLPYPSLKANISRASRRGPLLRPPALFISCRSLNRCPFLREHPLPRCCVGLTLPYFPLLLWPLCDFTLSLFA